MFMVVILLNFLIAVISQRYEFVQAQKLTCIYKDRADLNLEYYEIKRQFTTLRGIRYNVFTVSSEIAQAVEED